MSKLFFGHNLCLLIYYSSTEGLINKAVFVRVGRIDMVELETMHFESTIA